jgi:penicillin-binding protein 2
MSRERKAAEVKLQTTRRGLLVMGGQLAVVGVLGWRMRELQIKQADDFLLLAEENRVNIRLIEPARGLIFDRQGKPVALNRQNYRIVMVREQAREPEKILNRLAQIIPLSAAQIERVLSDMRQRPAFVPVTVVEHLTWKQFSQVALNAPILPGVITEEGMTRHYPQREDLAHVIGYVGPVSDYDLANTDDTDPLLQIPKFQIGKSGIEKAIEGSLRGSAGTRRIEVNSLGRVMRELSRIEGVEGTDIQLTLNLDLQNYAQRRLDGESASAVVMDVNNGDIVAMASAPSFDPNSFVLGIGREEYSALNSNKYRPLYNKAVSGAYPPGSTFKIIVALAALEAGEIDTSEDVWCPGFMRLGNRRFHCWKRGGHGHVNLKEALKFSCDVYFYETAKRVGIERITDMAQRLGLGIRPDLPMPAISEGLTPTKTWKRAVHDESWLVGDTLNAGIGQGFVLASPLQLAIMTARLASGKAVNPRLIRAVGGAPVPTPDAPDLGIPRYAIKQVQDALFAVSNERRGTAFRSRIVAEGMEMSGKTGTSQVRQITAAERAAGVFKNEDLPWERRDHALFVAFAPHDNPRYAISVIVEHGGGGSKAAAPIARDIMLQALYNGTPPLDAYPSAQHDEIKQRREEMPKPTDSVAANAPRDRA